MSSDADAGLASLASVSPNAAPSFRRRVFYISGYDPFHPRRYRELYRREGAAQAAISGYELALRPMSAAARDAAAIATDGIAQAHPARSVYGWQVETRIDGVTTLADIEVLVWTDLVRQSMAQGILATYLQLFRTAWAYIGSGALFRLMRLRKGPMIAALYPVGMLLLQLFLALLGAALLAMLSGRLLQGQGLPRWPGLLPGLGLGLLILRGFRGLDHRLFAYYLMHDYAYSAQAQGANPPELEARMAAFARAIRAALASDVDEVLLVGHSSGAHLGVSILADLLREGLPVNRPALGFLSLGQVVPMVSFLPGARRLRADLRDLSCSDALFWLDVTAPGDGCAFALCDPVAVTGVAPEGQKYPLILSAAFSQTLSPARWRALRWRFFRLHFQYLCAFDRPADYDYFQLTAGPQTLAGRYAGRAASKSRIDRPVNRHIST